MEKVLMNFVMAHVALGTNMVQYFKSGDTLDKYLALACTEGIVIENNDGYEVFGLKWERIWT